MTLTVNTNIASLQAQQSIGITQDSLANTIQRLSTGYRINSAKDDAAGLAIAAGLSLQIRGLTQGARNGNDGISMIQTAEGGLNQTLSLLQRMHELATQASSGTYSSSDLTNLNNEYASLQTEIDEVAATVNFNGINVMDGSTTTVSVQVGSNNTTNDRLSLGLIEATSTTLGVTGDVLTSADAQTEMDALSLAITTVTTGLSSLGASQTNLEEAVAGDIDLVTNLQAARSRIQDTDFAEESANLSKLQILQQSGAAMLSQANATAQVVLKLLQ